MGWKEFIASIVSSTVWPMLILFFLWKFKDSITGLINRLRKVTTNNFSAELADIEDSLIDQVSVTKDFNQSVFGSDKEYSKLVQLKPDLGIIETWKIIDEKIRSFTRSVGNEGEITDIKEKRTIPIDFILELLSDVVGKNTFNALKKLKSIRNEVMHSTSSQISYSDAILYRENCKDIYKVLDSINLEHIHKD